jgi:hypothetical protein
LRCHPDRLAAVARTELDKACAPYRRFVQSRQMCRALKNRLAFDTATQWQ